jgi:hypothetical protein
MAGADDLRPLDAAIDEIRLLHEAAERAAARIDAETAQLTGGQDPTDALVADVAEALVERTEMIRGDCERLSALLRRARAALAASAGAAPAAPLGDVAPALAEPLPSMSAERYSDEPPYEAPRYADPEPPPRADWRFWRRHRGSAEPGRPGEAPPRLPQLDYSGIGVGPVTEPHDPRSGGRSPVPEGVRLIATQMAVAGASRVEIERRLQRQFGIADAGSALDEIFGYGSSTTVE